MTDDICSLCLEPIYNDSFTSVCCNNTFHSVCNSNYIKYCENNFKEVSCPLCRFVSKEPDTDEQMSVVFVTQPPVSNLYIFYILFGATVMIGLFPILVVLRVIKI
jgi:predicted amidophosphoribosyltransferase